MHRLFILQERVAYRNKNMHPSVGASIILALILFVKITLGSVSVIQQPSCEDVDADGSQPDFICKGETSEGRCFCCGTLPNTQAPRRVFGWSWLRSESDPEADKMTCSCSRQRAELTRKDVSIHCSENGNYDKLQCDNGVCWCVEPMTGRPTERVYPESMMRKLPCYLEKPISSRFYYTRQCESAALARVLVLKKFEIHGTKNIHIDMPLCDYDGSYSAYRFDKKYIHCTWKDGKKIGEFAPSVTDNPRTTCNCARDSVLYAEENIEFTRDCASTGDYNVYQISNGMPYCVDKDGFPTTTLGDDGDTIQCPPNR